MDRLRGERRREREITARQPFREAQEVGHHGLGLAGGQGAEATEAGEDLVEDEVDAVVAAEVGDGRDEARGLLDHAGGALHARLQDEAGQALAALREQPGERLERGRAVRARDAAGALGMRGRGQAMDGEEPGFEAGVEGPAVSQGHRAEGVAVVGAREGRDLAALQAAGELPVLEGELERDLDGVGAVVGEEAAGEDAVGEGGELGGELRRARVVQAEEGDVRDLVELGAQGGVEIRVVVPVDVRPDRGVAVEVAPALGVDQPAPLAAHEVQAGVVHVLPHLGERMPGMPPVGGIQGVEGRRGRRGGRGHKASVAGRGRLLSPKPPDLNKARLAFRKYGFTVRRMKTTVILPDDLVRRAKVRAAERGETLSGLMARALESALAEGTAVQEGPARKTYWSGHVFPIPSRKGGRGTDSTKIISEDRDGR